MGLGKNGNAMDPIRFLYLAPSEMTLFMLLVSEPCRGFRFYLAETSVG